MGCSQGDSGVVQGGTGLQRGWISKDVRPQEGRNAQQRERHKQDKTRQGARHCPYSIKDKGGNSTSNTKGYSSQSSVYLHAVSLDRWPSTGSETPA